MMIREAVLKDCDSIAETHVSSWQHTYNGLLPDSYLASLSIPDRASAWRESLLRERSKTLIAIEDKNTLGFVNFGRSRDLDSNPIYTGEIYAIYLHPKFQGQGIGSALWQQAVDSLAESGCTDITLWVLNTNSTARRFYELKKCEFDGTLKQDVIGGKDVTEMRYRLSLE